MASAAPSAPGPPAAERTGFAREVIEAALAHTFGNKVEAAYQRGDLFEKRRRSRLGEAARFSFPVHPHMFRHACGYKLANDGRDTRALQHYLGDKSIQHTVRYTKLSPDRFRDFWHD
jgi:site-specific recombinase XerC